MKMIFQKILWAVSKALTDKQISNNHEKFKEFASILAKLVKKIFLEFHDPVKKSISEELMRFASLMVTQVVVHGHNSEHVHSETRKFLLQKLNSSKTSTFLASSCSSLSLKQQSENLNASGSSKSLLALRENGNSLNKKFGSESNVNSSSVLKAKRQISF